jgi:hypothetical protein
MTRTLAVGIAKLLTLAFTGVVAPVLVTLITQSVKSHDGPTSSTPSRAETQRVAVRASGRTPEEALRNGLRDAVRAEITSLRTETGELPEAVLQTILERSGDLVLCWEEKGGRIEAWPNGFVYHKDLIVTVNRAALAERLKTTHADSWTLEDVPPGRKRAEQGMPFR